MMHELEYNNSLLPSKASLDNLNPSEKNVSE